jgi:patatin-like phospholipase/acyl hydrolase
MIDKAYILLYSEMYRYKSGYFKKWMCLTLGLIIGSCLIYPTISTLQFLLYAKYDRSGMDSVLQEKFTNLTFNDIAVDELLIPSYEFNQDQPRFYSKYFLNRDPGVYNISLWEACASSASAPLYFDPNSLKNDYDFESRLIDGGTICNNPSLYAFMYAKYLRGHTKIRLISLGTGSIPEDKEQEANDDS